MADRGREEEIVAQTFDSGGFGPPPNAVSKVGRRDSDRSAANKHDLPDASV